MRYFILLLILFLFQLCRAQQFYLSGGAETASSGNVESSFNQSYHDYKGKINGGFRWMAGAELVLRSKFGIGVSNYNQKSTAEVTLYKNTPEHISIDETVNWLMVIGNKYIDLKEEKFSFFGGLGSGLATFKSGGFLAGATDDSFAWQVQTGILFWPTKSIGIRVSGQYQMALGGTQFAFTSLANKSTEVEDSTPFSQLSGGISLVLNMSKLSESN